MVKGIKGKRCRTVLREGPYRFFFYASDRTEPEHVHVERDDRAAKFWIDPVRLHRSGGMRRSEIRRIARDNRGEPNGSHGGVA